MELSEEQKVMFETVVSESFQVVLQNMLAPVVSLELLKRKEALTEKEVEALYGISANTLRTKRARGGGPAYRARPGKRKCPIHPQRYHQLSGKYQKADMKP